MIIAVDYDGTLEINGEINFNLISRLKAAQRSGTHVILWSCREGNSLVEAVRKLNQAGFFPNRINDNMPESIKRLGYNSRKIIADVYIDDKAAR